MQWSSGSFHTASREPNIHRSLSETYISHVQKYISRIAYVSQNQSLFHALLTVIYNSLLTNSVGSR